MSRFLESMRELSRVRAEAVQSTGPMVEGLLNALSNAVEGSPFHLLLACEMLEQAARKAVEQRHGEVILSDCTIEVRDTLAQYGTPQVTPCEQPQPTPEPEGGG